VGIRFYQGAYFKEANMPDDKKVVKDEVSTETESKEEKTEDKKEDTLQSQPFNEDQQAKITQMIAEETEKVRRVIQGDKDKAIAEIHREADRKVKFAETEAASYKTSFADLDDEAKNVAELARLRGRDTLYQQREAEESQARSFDAYKKRLNESLYKHVETLGIDPKDKRIDWAEDATDFLDGRGRFDASVARILKETQKVADEKLKGEIKEEIAKARKELGLDSVDTSTSAGASGDKFTLGQVKDYSTKGKTTQEIMKDAEKVAKQMTEK